MKELLMKATSGDMAPETLSQQIRTDTRPEMRNRRAIAGASLVGMAAMGIVALLQMGIVRRLPDPPTDTPNFDTEKVNTSKEAYSYGMPDGALVLVTHAATIALAAAGPPDRYDKRGWLPIAAAAAAIPQALMAAKYLFYQMPKVDKAWCPYCVLDALSHFTVTALTLPEAARALGLRGRAATAG